MVVAAFASATTIPFMWSFPQYSSFDHTIATPLALWGDISGSASALDKSVGQTWFDPAVGQIEDATGLYVMMGGSGFLSLAREAEPQRNGTRAGTTVYLIDAGTGAVHDSYDVGDSAGKSHLKNALQADPTATGPPASTFVDQIYIGDTEGSLWRFSVSAAGGSASLSVPVETHDAGQAHPLYASLATVNVGGPTQFVFLATGIDILPVSNKIENFRLLGIKDDRSVQSPGTEEFSYPMQRQVAVIAHESVTSAPAVAGEVVFFTTTTAFPADPCRCEESSLYALTYDGNTAYASGSGAGTAGGLGPSRRSRPGTAGRRHRSSPTSIYTSSPAQDMRVLGDPDDYNNGVTQQGVRITSWREIR